MMNRVLALVLCILVCFQLAACGGEKACEHEYESEVVNEASYYLDGEIKKRCIFCNDEITETIPKLDIPIELTVTNLKTVEQEREPLVMPDGMEIFQPSIYWIVFEMDVKNVSDDDLSGFSGQITITDNDRKLNVSGSFDEKIKAGESVHLTDYGFQVTHNDMTLADNMLMDKSIEEIEIEFTLNKVQFNTISQ